MTEHARLGASNSTTWLNCTAQPAMAEGKARKPSVYAAEGTAAHHLAECILDGKPWPDAMVIDGHSIAIDAEMQKNVYLYTDHCEEIMDQSFICGLERRVHLDGLWPGQPAPEPLFGTADFWAVNTDQTRATLRDLKYGAGVGVEVEGNTQLMYYGLGLLLELALDGIDPDVFDLGIVQPRFDHPDGPVRSLVMTRDELLDWGNDILKPTVEAIAGNAVVFRDGPWCRWCPAAGSCTHLASKQQALARDAFDGDAVSPIIHGLDNDELADILNKLPDLKKWIDAVQHEAESRIYAGDTIPGWKLKPGRAVRRWTDEDAVGRLAVDVSTDPHVLHGLFVVKSPAQMEKALKGTEYFEDFEQYIDATPKGMTLARDDSTRVANPPSNVIDHDEVDPSVFEMIEKEERQRNG